MTDEHRSGQGAITFPTQKPRPTPKERFDEFHEANPWVYDELLRMTRQLVDRGHKHLGMKMLFETLRWSTMIGQVSPTGPTTFRLSNSCTAHYARMIMDNNPDLQGVFTTRPLRADAA